VTTSVSRGTLEGQRTERSSSVYFMLLSRRELSYALLYLRPRFDELCFCPPVVFIRRARGLYSYLFIYLSIGTRSGGEYL